MRPFLASAAHRTMLGVSAAAVAAMFVPAPGSIRAEPVAEDTRPLSPAQIALFETPHLANVTAPETLNYAITRAGVAPFSDTIAVHVRKINPDGTKDLAFDYMTGERRARFPELDHFRGNPLLMLTLERDVTEMHDAVGAAASYFRNHIRESFVADATVTDTTYDLNGTRVPAREVRVQPFAKEERLRRVPSLMQKTYTFVLADAVPGMLAEIRIETPADATMNIPAFTQRTTFAGVTP